MNGKIQNYVVKPFLALVAVSCLAGCSGNQGNQDQEYNPLWGAAPAYDSDGNVSLYTTWILDQNGDGDADMILDYGKHVAYIADEHEIIGNWDVADAKIMTPEQREVASRGIAVDQELSDLIR